MKTKIALMVAAALFVFAWIAPAAPKTLDAFVPNVPHECSVDTKPIVFPEYSVYSTTPVDAVGAINYKCTSDQQGITTTFRITVEPTADGSFQHRMHHSDDALLYDLFIDPMRTTLWGNGSKGTLAFIGACCPVGKNSTANIYARIPAGQDVGSGKYSDVVVVTFEF